MRCLYALLLASCITDHALELELRPPRAADGTPEVPEDVAAHEVRVYRLDGEGCPDLETAASAAPFATFAHAQSFDGEAGEPIGELPRGVWAIAAISRDAACAPRLYGCTEITIGDGGVVVVDLAPVIAEPICGCRACDRGTCAPIDAICR